MAFALDPRTLAEGTLAQSHRTLACASRLISPALAATAKCDTNCSVAPTTIAPNYSLKQRE